MAHRPLVGAGSRWDGTRCLGAGDVDRWDAMWNGRDGLLAVLWVQAIVGTRRLPTSLKEGRGHITNSYLIGEFF